MGELSKIEWCEHTFNPWWGCTKVSQGCKNCYADGIAHRYGHDVWGPTAGRRPMSENYWKNPYKWNKKAAADGVRARVFCASMADVFEGFATCTEEAFDLMESQRQRLWKVIQETPNLDWLLLTKRPENIMPLIPLEWWKGFPDNVWVGTSVESQQVDPRMAALQHIPARVRFLSMEPLLAPVEIGLVTDIINWVIVGGESGPKARPMQQAWVEQIHDRCITSGIPFFFKQWGEHNQDGVRVGKKNAGRLLNGQEWNEVPTSKHFF